MLLPPAASSLLVYLRGSESDAPLRPAIKTLNSLLPEALKDCPQVTLLDIWDKFLSADGSLSTDLMSDGTHPTEKGYAIWDQALVDSGILSAP